MTQYIYLGDGLTGKRFKGKICTTVRRKSGKCVRGRSKMLVMFNGEKCVVLARRLRKTKTTKGLLKSMSDIETVYKTSYFLTIPYIEGI